MYRLIASRLLAGLSAWEKQRVSDPGTFPSLCYPQSSSTAFARLRGPALALALVRPESPGVEVGAAVPHLQPNRPTLDKLHSQPSHLACATHSRHALRWTHALSATTSLALTFLLSSQAPGIDYLSLNNSFYWGKVCG